MRPSQEIGSFISGVGDVLQELNIEESTIKTILATLEDSMSEMPDTHAMPPVAEGVFTVLPAGRQMGFHTNNAQAYMRDVMVEMMKVLGLYADGVTAIHQGAGKTDDSSAELMTTINKVVEQVTEVNRSGHGEGKGQP